MSDTETEKANPEEELIIKKLEEAYQNAKATQDRVTAIFEQVKTIQDEVNRPETGLQALLSQAGSAKEQINSLRGQSDTLLQSMNDSLVSIKKSVDEIHSGYTVFTEIKKKSEDPESGLKVILTKAAQALEKLTTLESQAVELLVNMNTSLVSIEEKVAVMNKSYASFEEAKGHVEHPESGLQATLDASHALLNGISTLKKESDNLLATIRTNTKESTKLLIQAKESYKNITDLEKQSISTKDRIFKILNITQDASLANSFDKRKDEIRTSLEFWKIATIILTILLISLLSVIYFTSDNKFSATFFARITLTTPLLIAILFSTKQYGVERYYLEQYSFKSAVAFSLESYTQLLSNRFKKNEQEDKILNFVIESINKVYENPTIEKAKKNKKTLEFPLEFDTPMGKMTISPTLTETTTLEDKGSEKK